MIKNYDWISTQQYRKQGDNGAMPSKFWRIVIPKLEFYTQTIKRKSRVVIFSYAIHAVSQSNLPCTLPSKY